MTAMTDHLTTPDFHHDIPLAPMTTIGLGGPARMFIDCASVDAMRAVLEFASRQSVRLQVMGGGSNLIFPDHGFDGIVMRVATRGIEWRETGGGAALLRVQAGERWDDVVKASIERGFAGIECLSGIPGSAGATPIQNVGAYGQDVAETITEVRALDRASGEEAVFSNAECAFGYRMSRFKAREANRWIVTEVTFRLAKTDRPSGAVYPELRRYLESQANEHPGGIDLAFIRDAVIALRRKKSMVVDPADPNTRSVGSFFMNPVVPLERFETLSRAWSASHPNDRAMPSFPSSAGVKIPAAWLIEHAGFPKGYRKGGVGISSNHTLALVNHGGTTRELLALADEIRRGVESVFSISLEREAIAVD